jgi:hypothetical protein
MMTFAGVQRCINYKFHDQDPKRRGSPGEEGQPKQRQSQKGKPRKKK